MKSPFSMPVVIRAGGKFGGNGSVVAVARLGGEMALAVAIHGSA